MIHIKHVAVYVCLLQVINRQLTGTLAANVSINQNIIGLLGNTDTILTCSFVLERDEAIISLDIISKNITDVVYDIKKPIAIFQPERAAKLHPSAKYLSGRVTLTNITNTSTKATLKFHKLNLEDEKDYICKYNLIDQDGLVFVDKSEPARILVKDPVGDVHISKRPNQRQYDRKINSITLNCKASGDPKPKYAWFKEANNSNIISNTNHFVIEGIVQNNSGLYICEAYNLINNITHRQTSSVEIVIVDEMLLSPEPAASSAASSGHAVYAVPVILVILVVVAIIVIFLFRRKHDCNRSTNEKNKKSSCRNRISCFKRWHSSDGNLSYISVADKKEQGDISNDTKENENICKNNEKDIEKNFDIIQNLPTTSNNIYAVPFDSLPEETVTCKIVKDRGENENNGVSDQDPVYSEVFNETKMKYEMSMERTSEPPDIADGISADRCHV